MRPTEVRDAFLLTGYSPARLGCAWQRRRPGEGVEACGLMALYAATSPFAEDDLKAVAWSIGAFGSGFVEGFTAGWNGEVIDAAHDLDALELDAAIDVLHERVRGHVAGQAAWWECARTFSLLPPDRGECPF